MHTLTSTPVPVVYGALLGVQEGRNIEICNSFELLVNVVDGRVSHDQEYFTSKEKQCNLPLTPP